MFETSARVPSTSVIGVSSSSVTRARRPSRRIPSTRPTRTPATRTADLSSSPATESKSASTRWPALPQRFRSSIRSTSQPRTSRQMVMKIPTFSA